MRPKLVSPLFGGKETRVTPIVSNSVKVYDVPELTLSQCLILAKS